MNEYTPPVPSVEADESTPAPVAASYVAGSMSSTWNTSASAVAPAVSAVSASIPEPGAVANVSVTVNVPSAMGVNT